MSTTTTTDTVPATFVWDNDFDNHEQVRPYLAAFLAAKVDVIAEYGYPYNDSFRGRIPGLSDADQSTEDTGIYLLQGLVELDKLALKIAAFTDKGGRPLSDFPVNTEMRGTLVRYGWYLSGSGWDSKEDVRVILGDEGMGQDIQFKLPRQRNWRCNLGDRADRYLFCPTS